MTDATKKVALVTGAGGGLGREIALQLARRRCRVAVLDINAAGAEETVKLCAAEGGDAFAIVADLTAKNSAASVVRRAAGDCGRLDILINNAGYGAIEAFLDMTELLWERTLAINVRALAMLTVAAGRLMRDQKSGRIVNITSPASRMALPNYTAYAASKAGVDAITRAAAVARSRPEHTAGRESGAASRPGPGRRWRTRRRRGRRLSELSYTQPFCLPVSLNTGIATRGVCAGLHPILAWPRCPGRSPISSTASR